MDSFALGDWGDVVTLAMNHEDWSLDTLESRYRSVNVAWGGQAGHEAVTTGKDTRSRYEGYVENESADRNSGRQVGCHPTSDALTHHHDVCRTTAKVLVEQPLVHGLDIGVAGSLRGLSC